jgi:hypothetical protein
VSPGTLSDKELLLKQAELGLRDPYYFETEILEVGKEDDLPRAESEIRPFLNWFDQPRPPEMRPEEKDLIYWSSPRFTAKTVCLASVITKWIIENPNIAILYMCELKSMAADTGGLIMEWLESKKVEQLYSVFKANKNWSKDSFIVRQRSIKRRDPTFHASGMDVAMQSYHPDVIVWDDLIGESNCNIAGFAKAKRRLHASMPVLRQGGKGVYLCTRWGEEDPASEILAKAAKGHQWRAPGGRGFFGAYAVEGDEKFFEGAVAGEPLFTTVLPEEEIETYRRDWPYDLYSSQILNDPAPLEGRYFPSEFRYFEPFDQEGSLIKELQEGLNYMAIDVAGGKEMLERGDETVLGCGNARWVGPNPQLRILDAVGGKWKTDRVIDNFFTLVDKWRPVKIFVETNIAKEWLMDPLRKRAKMLGIHLPLEEIHWGKGDAKKDRIKALVQPYAYGQIEHALHLKNTKLEIQTRRWRPGGKVHDDWPDFTAMLWLNACKKVRRKRKEGWKVGSVNRGRARYQSTRV